MVEMRANWIEKVAVGNRDVDGGSLDVELVMVLNVEW